MTSDPASEVIQGQSSKNGCFSDFERQNFIKNIKKAKAMEVVEVVKATEVIEVTVTDAI